MADAKAIEALLRANNEAMLVQMKALNEENNKSILVMMSQTMDQKIDVLRKEFDDKLAKLTAEEEGSERKRSRSAGPGIRKTVQSGDHDVEFKVKVIGFPVDTRKIDAESTLTKSCAKEEGFIEAYMPGSRNDFAFVKFDSESARRRFLNRVHSDELVAMHAQQKLRFLRCRTLEQKNKTKHIDKCKRVIIELVKAKYPNVEDKVLNGTIETGMNEGGVAWIGGVRVAEMVASGNGEKTFTINSDKVTSELNKAGWNVDGAGIATAHKNAMDQ